jgi:predicted outer membrane repeat protein
MTRTEKKETCLNLSGWSKFTMNKKLIFSLVLTFLLTTVSTAATLNVPGSYATIQAAITVAVSGDIIEIADGTYTAAGFYNIDFNGKLITVRSASGDPTKCIIDCGNISGRRGFYFHHNESSAAVVENITIKRAYGYFGGAIECDGASPTISNCIITNNRAAFGAAIDCFEASPVIENCIITNNTSTYYGGAIECGTDSTPHITNCLIANNTAGSYGGAIDCYDFASPVIINCTIADNTGSGGFGGVYASYGSSSTIRNSILWNNGDDIYGPTTVSYSCIQDNDAGTGNIKTNPLFRTGSLGNYYLSQIAAGQLADSNCVNATINSVGSIFTGGIFTTRTDNVGDINNADMGFHYPGGGLAAQCKLITKADLTAGSGTIDPNYPAPGQDYKQFSEISVQATPAVGNKLLQWIDANTATYIPGNPSTYHTTPGPNNIFIATLDVNTTVIAQFSSVATYKLITYVNDGNGSITNVNPNYFPDPCDTRAYFIPQHTSATITVQPNAGYVVDQWLKGETATFDINNPDTYDVMLETGNSLTTTIDADTTIIVKFKYQKYQLTASVVGVGGEISPWRGSFAAGTTVQLYATPYSGYRVRAWGGDLDPANKPKWNVTTNTVVMNANKNVTVQFETDQNKRIDVPTEIADIQTAIGAANSGDTIKIAPGTYIGTGFWITGNKSITIEGDPEHPETVVIDCENEIDGGFRITSSQTCVLKGLTIANARTSVITGEDANGPEGPGENGGWNVGKGIYLAGGNHQVLNCIVRNAYAEGGDAGNGYDGNSTILPGSKGGNGGWAAGAGIFIDSGSPLIKNSIIQDCCAVGGNGGNGGNGVNVTDGNTGIGGQGGLAGAAYGGGIACWNGANPTFENCSIINCRATGGIGGIGGNSGRNWPGAYGGLTPEPDAIQGDITLYSARGGGVYIGQGSNAKFINCKIIDNTTEGSVSGLGGLNYYEVQQQPRKSNHLISYGSGVFCDMASDANFAGCLIQNNEVIITNNRETIISNNSDTSCGGGLALWKVGSAIIKDCNFTLNSSPIGSGIYGNGSDIQIADCNITNNNSYSGGGILTQDCNAVITKSFIKGNIAGTQLSATEDIGYTLFGTGGGVYAISSLINISDTVITENYARIMGGGICLDGDTTFIRKPLIKNCLITKNTAVDLGGGIASIYLTKPQIQNCTITENIVADVNSKGGGLFCSYGSDTIVKDTIFWANSGINGSQISLSDGGLFINMPAKLTVTYSDIDLRYGAALDFTQSESGGGSGTSARLIDEQTIYDTINSSGSAKVIISLAEPAGAQTINWSSPALVSALQSQIATLQNQVLSTLNPGEFSLRHKLTNLAVFSGNITSAGLSKLLVNSTVAHIEPVRTINPMLAQAIPLANALTIRPTYNGLGNAIAIVDTGIDYRHPRLGGGAFPNSKVIGGYDTGDGDNNPLPTNSAHGTCCAGIAAGLLGTVGDYIGGVAYNAKLYALKISQGSNDIMFNDAALAAWDWCITHRNDNPANPIRVLSNSWGIYNYPINNSAAADAFSPAFTTAAQRAVDTGITILAASGNDGFAGQGISWPAAMSNVISVGAVYDTTDTVTGYSNTADNLDILAPADPVYTTDIVGSAGYSTDDYYPYFSGTSSACPFAAGCVAVLQSASVVNNGTTLSPEGIRNILKMTGKPVTDTKVAITKPRVNLGAAIALLSQTTPIYTERNCTIVGIQKDVNDRWTAAGSSNISEDPNFVPGLDYYLSHIDTMQDCNSPCFDIGSTLAANLGLSTYTTRIDNFKDAGIVDLGYHHSKGITTRYELRVDVNGPASGTIKTPWLPGNTYNVYGGQIITLKAVPDANYKVASWFVDDVNQQTDSNNLTITMNKNKKVAVSFEIITVIPPPEHGKLYVPSQYPDLGSAINAAQNGDRIILDRGTYSWNDTNFDYSTIYINGKNITITSTAPDEPDTVAQTIILGNGFSLFNVDRTMVIEGITIQDAHYYAGTVNCSATWAHSADGDGYNGYNILGGAMRLYNASPTIRNCRFINCSATASDGCNGNDTGDGGWAGWAHGGAIGIDEASNPLIKNCDFIDCYAQGGNGGNGGSGNPNGHGGNWGDPNSGRWDFGPYQPYWYYSGKGGAIYCASGSKPVIENCFFQGNVAYSGTSGLSNIDGWPNYNYAISSFGGAVYIARGSEAKLTDCIFIDNEADTRGQIGDVNATGIFVLYSPVVSYGGAICAENTSVKSAADTIQIIENCTFIDNRACAGGGVYWKDATAYLINNTFENCTSMIGGGMSLVSSNSIVVDCDFSNNQAVHPAGQGGAIYCESSTAKFYDCQIQNNAVEVCGGGAYFTGNSDPNMHNCLITNNNAYRDGGGVSANWNTRLTLSNCTITNNTVSGTGFASGYGGGLSCAYETHTKVINSILWNNNAEYGSEISIGNIFDAANKYGAQVDVSYNDIKDGQAGVFVDTEHSCILNWGAGNFNGTSLESPLFVNGPWGNFYLSQTATPDTNQVVDSPCVDTGYGTAVDNSMYKHTTRTDHIIDIADSNVDMGYHYTLTADLLGDFNFDGIVTLEDFGLFILCWMDDGCTFPYFCSGRDLNKDGRVDFEDFAIFAENYGKTETTPPKPNPMTWASSPRSAGLNSITMRATAARDNSSTQIEYYFECVSGGGHNRDWDPNTTYTDTGLNLGQPYGYHVKARDAKHNETLWSVIGYAVPGDDTTKPEPSPMTWATAPQAISSTSIEMVATTATDTSGVEYYFTCTAGGGHNSGWQDSRFYTDTGLLPSTMYTYIVEAQDKSDAKNKTQPSIPASATTPAADGPDLPPTNDIIPPTPNPSQWSVTPRYFYDGQFYYHTMTAVEATDETLPVEYYFECTNGAGTSSGWQPNNPTWVAGPYLVPNYSVYRVYTRDGRGNTGSPSPKYDTNRQLVP